MITAVAHPPFPARQTRPTVLWRHPVVLSALALVVLRAVYLPFPNLFPEEAYYWNYGQHLALGYLDHPPLVAWLIRLGGLVFGHNELGVRVFAPLCSLVTSFFVFRLADLLYGRRAALTTLLLVQALPFFFLSGWIMTPDAPLTACWAGLLCFLARVCFAGSARAWWGVGICLGVGMLSKYTVALLGPATLLFLALDPPSRLWFRRISPYAAVALAVLIFSPVIAWNATHHWASFAFQSTGRLHEPRHFSVQELLGAIALLLTPLGVFLAGEPLFTRGGSSPVPVADQALERRRRLFARVFTLTPLAVFAFFSLTHRVKLNWTGPLWLAVLPLVAARLTAAFADPASFLPGSPARWVRRSALATAAVLGVGYCALLQYLAFGLPGVAWTRHTELLPVGWPQLARAVDRQAADLRLAQPARVLVVGLDRDFIASEAAFYAADPARAVRETTGAHLFGGISLMYAYWFPVREQEDATLLLVSFDRKDLNSIRARMHCRPLGPVETAWIQVNGQPVRPYFTQVGYHFREKRLSPPAEVAHPLPAGEIRRVFVYVAAMNITQTPAYAAQSATSRLAPFTIPRREPRHHRRCHRNPLLRRMPFRHSHLRAVNGGQRSIPASPATKSSDGSRPLAPRSASSKWAIWLRSAAWWIPAAPA